MYKQLEAENRLTTEATGDNTDSSMNFIPKMNSKELVDGYRKVIKSIYSVKPYYKRLRQLLINYKHQPGKQKKKVSFSLLMTFFKSVYVISFLNKGRGEYWKLIFWTLCKRPRSIVDAITFTFYGYHFRTIYGLE